MKGLDAITDWCHAQISPDPREWLPGLHLLRWNDGTPLTVGQSLEHVMCLGRSGSGKTSGGIKTIAMGMLHAGYGVLFLSAKATDAGDYLAWAKLAGREKSVVRFGPGQPLGFNLLQSELARGGPLEDRTMNIAAIFSAVGEITARNQQDRNGEKFWQEASEQLLRNALNVELLAKGTVDLDAVIEVVMSAPTTQMEAGDSAWRRESVCHQRLLVAEERNPDSRTVRLAREYFLQQWPRFPAETKNSVLFTLTAVADLFRRDPLHRLFFSLTDFTPEILKDGAVLIVESSALADGNQGKVVNGLMRLATERMMQRRVVTGQERPVAIIWDEFQTSVTRADSAFAAVARSPRCALVLATQNLPGVEDAIGHDAARAFLGNCRTQLFFANGNEETNRYMAELSGKWPVKKYSTTRDHRGNASRTESVQDEYGVPERKALGLETGGEECGGRITGVVIQNGQSLTGGKPFMDVKFNRKASPLWSWLNYFTKNTAAVGWARPAPDFRWLR